MKFSILFSTAILFAGFGLSYSASSALAAPVVTLTSSAMPEPVGPGETLTVNVTLSGLVAGEELDSLAATISYDDTLFGPATISLGDILPDPLDDPLDVLTIEDAGLADVSFLTLGLSSANHIQSNGLFFSFTATALQPGQASFSFDFVDATEFNSADPGLPIPGTASNGGDLLVTVVPEPSGIGLLLLGAVVALPMIRRER